MSDLSVRGYEMSERMYWSQGINSYIKNHLIQYEYNNETYDNCIFISYKCSGNSNIARNVNLGGYVKLFS